MVFKRRITSEDSTELSVYQKEKLQKWWGDTTEGEYLKVDDSIFPLLDIGQMIQLIQEDGFPGDCNCWSYGDINPWSEDMCDQLWEEVKKILAK